jgi:hypothetical protein
MQQNWIRNFGDDKETKERKDDFKRERERKKEREREREREARSVSDIEIVSKRWMTEFGEFFVLF